MGRLIARLAVAGLIAVGVLAGRPPEPATAAAEPGFGRPAASASFGSSVDFSQPVDDGADVVRAEILITYPGSVGPVVTEVGAPGDGPATLRHVLALSEGHIYPNTELRARWRLTYEDGTAAVGPEVSILYADDRYRWQTESGEVVRVHWIEGPASFGEEALEIAEAGIAEAEELLGVTETEPIDFFIYPDEASFYDALGPGTRENVGGQANADIRTMFALISPAEIDAEWVSIVIPHELTHLVFATAVDNPYHDPPRWLNEGLATYLENGYTVDFRSRVEAAAADGSLVPLAGLTGQFPATREGFYLAYAESVSAIDFIIRTHGQDALVELITSYAEGKTDDEAFEDAIGMDTAALDAAWFADLGATQPEPVGPQPDPAGPLPPGWGGPVPSADPVASATPGPGSSPAPDTADSSTASTVLLVGLAALGVAIAAGVMAWAVRRRREPNATSDSDPTSLPPEP
jgi:hypothetical protein